MDWEWDQISCLPNQAEYAGSVSGLGAFQAEAVHAARPYVKVHSVSESNESRPTADGTAGSYSWDTVR